MRHGTLLALLTILAACQYDPHAHLYATREPAVADVVGFYGCDSGATSQAWLDESGVPSMGVELRADGTFTATHLPRDSGEAHTDCAGTWQVKVVGGNEQDHFWGVLFELPGNRDAAAFLSGERSPHGLLFNRGDPDAGEALVLERRDV